VGELALQHEQNLVQLANREAAAFEIGQHEEFVELDGVYRRSCSRRPPSCAEDRGREQPPASHSWS